MRPLRSISVVTLLCLFFVPAFADTAYVYTGGAYDTFSSAGFQPTGLSGEFTVATSLGANLSLASIAPTAFSFTDGFFTLTNTTQFLSSQFLVSTNSLGRHNGLDDVAHAGAAGKSVPATRMQSLDQHERQRIHAGLVQK